MIERNFPPAPGVSRKLELAESCENACSQEATMRPLPLVLVLTLLMIFSSPARTQNPSPAPQTARQALLEMFVGKNSDAFAKHLPEAARPALMRKGETPETSLLQKISIAAHQLTAQGGHIETFDVGPVLLVSDKGH